MSDPLSSPIVWPLTINYDDPFPTFTPTPESWTLTAAERRLMRRPSNPQVAAADDLCTAGDLAGASLVERLIQEGTSVDDFRICLGEAIDSGNEFLLQRIVSFGVSINMLDVRQATIRTSTSLLSLF